MPAPSKIAQLPDDVRLDLDKRLTGNAFGDHVALSAWLSEQGYEISKSAVGRHSQQLKRRLDAIRASTDAARLIAAEAADDADERAGATISLLQTEVFEVLLLLREAEEEDDAATRVKLLSRASRAVADLTRASIVQKKWAAETRTKVLAEAAGRVEDAARAQGMTDEQARFWREKVLGVTG